MNQITYNYYPGGKTKALTMSFDDGRIFDRDLIKMFNKYGIKGTFHLISSRLGSDGYVKSEEIKELYAGHEISLHTHTHPTIAYMPRRRIDYEITENKRILERIAGREICGLSYPMGSFGDNVTGVMKNAGVLYGRTTLSTGTFALPKNFYEWHPTIHYSRGTQRWSKNLVISRSLLTEKANEFAEYFDWQRNMPIMQVWGHSYELDDNDDWDVMENFCKYISTINTVWFATNIEVADYVNALKQLRFTQECDTVYNPTAIDVWIGVNDKPVKVPGGKRIQLEG